MTLRVPAGTPPRVRARRLRIAFRSKHSFTLRGGVTMRRIVFGVIARWFVVIFLLGAAGALVKPPGTPPIPILIGATAPLAVFLPAYWARPAFRAFVLSANLLLCSVRQLS